MLCRRSIFVFSVLLMSLVAMSLSPLLVADANAQRKKVVFGEEEEGSVVEGYVHKPEVGYIITRQEQEDLETLQLKESLAPKIVRSVNKSPF
jgi:hypothetical protein